MEKEIKLEELTQEQKTELLKQLALDKKNERQKLQENKDALKNLQDEFVGKFWEKLTNIAMQLANSKKELFDNSQTIISLKKDIYNMSDEAMQKQQSHSISTANFDKTIIVGYNVVDGWDADLTAAGIEGVNKWIEKKIAKSDDTAKELVEAIRIFLKPNKDGILKASRVIEMASWASKNGDPDLIEAVGMIQNAYLPKKTSTYVKAKYRNEDGEDVWLNLSMSNA